jgi:hypothetical protein
MVAGEAAEALGRSINLDLPINKEIVALSVDRLANKAADRMVRQAGQRLYDMTRVPAALQPTLRRKIDPTFIDKLAQLATISGARTWEQPYRHRSSGTSRRSTRTNY